VATRISETTTSTTPHVLELIERRMRGEQDPYTLGLALEGGGMRGVVSGAMLLALRDLGVMPVFDRLYGTSSGSINLAYFAAGAAWDALSVYYDHLVAGFVRRPPLPGRPLLDMGRVREIICSVVPLDVDALAGSRYDVRFLLTDVVQRRPVVIGARSVADRAPEHLLAGAWLPILAGRPYEMGGHPYLDGGLLWPDPLYAALDEGCSHVLALNTAAAGGSGRTSPVLVHTLRRVLDGWSSGLGDAYLDGRRMWDADRPLLVSGREVDLRGTRVLRVQPGAGAHAVQRLTLDAGALLLGARAGYATIHDLVRRPMAGSYFAVVDGRHP
jgi:predicted acylesterase/phospholipase RssA